MLELLENVDLKQYTTLGVGGPATALVVVTTIPELQEAVKLAKKYKKWVVIGSGSNLVVDDAGYDGLVIVNKIQHFQIEADKVVVGSGMILNNLVDDMNAQGFPGFENLAGIPGTVGGAVYGNAGAYGQNISDHILMVHTLDKSFSKTESQFAYRDSLFKLDKSLVITEIEFETVAGEALTLSSQSTDIRKKREEKYPVGLKCPGSFFKNIIVSELTALQLKNINPGKINHGKISAGYLLEEVGAKGMKLGGARVADYHGNLLINDGTATALDIWNLGLDLQSKVKLKFDIQLEPEVQRLLL